MSKNWAAYSAYDQQRDMLNILMDSNFYFELSLKERRILLKHIVDSYCSPSLSTHTDAMKIEKRVDPTSPAGSLDQ
jgi:hypothetical protein